MKERMLKFINIDQQSPKKRETDDKQKQKVLKNSYPLVCRIRAVRTRSDE